MTPSKQWEDEQNDSSTPPSSPPMTGTRRRQFHDEEGDDDVIDSWDADEDSEVEREKERKAAEAKTKAAAEAAANKKPKSQRVAEHQAERARQRAADEEESSEVEETEAERRDRLRRIEQDADLRHAKDLLGNVGINSGRKNPTVGTSVAVDPKDPNNVVNLATLPLFNPQNKSQFEQMCTVIGPIIAGNSKKAHYGLFLEELVKELVKDLSSEKIKKAASALTRLSNEKMKEEKAADKGGKKTKAARTKTTLVANRSNATDLTTYDDDAFDDNDFM